MRYIRATAILATICSLGGLSQSAPLQAETGNHIAPTSVNLYHHPKRFGGERPDSGDWFFEQIHHNKDCLKTDFYFVTCMKAGNEKDIPKGFGDALLKENNNCIHGDGLWTIYENRLMPKADECPGQNRYETKLTVWRWQQNCDYWGKDYTIPENKPGDQTHWMPTRMWMQEHYYRKLAKIVNPELTSWTYPSAYNIWGSRVKCR